MRRVLMLIVGFSVFLWTTEGWSQTQSQNREQTREEATKQTQVQTESQTQKQTSQETATQTRPQQQTTNQARLRQHALHDVNGDGICDLCGNPVGSGNTNAQGQAAKKGKHWGPGDGTGNQSVGPRDGTGYGAQSGQKMGPRYGTGQQTNPGTGGGGCRGCGGGRR
jgi:RNA polymerase-binding transcription factor DksA